MNENEAKIFLSMWDSITNEIVFVINNGEVEYQNINSIELLKTIKENYNEDIHYLLRLIPQEEIEINKKMYNIKSLKTSDRNIIILKDISNKIMMEQEKDSVKKINDDFSMLCQNFAENSMYITDGEGKTIYVGKHIAEECGVPAEYLLGKDVRELETESIFYPSICKKVLSTLQVEVIFQKTNDENQSIAMGFPIFDSNNNLTKIYSFSKRIKVKNKKNYKLEGLDYEIDPFYPEIISNSTNMLKLKEMIKICAKVDSPVMIFGETGSGKGSVAKCIHKFSRFKDSNFLTLDCTKLSNEDAEEVKKFNKYFQLDKGTIYLKDIDRLPVKYQKVLLNIFSNPNVLLHRDIRIISGTTLTEEEMNSNDIINNSLRYSLCTITLNTLPLRDRREDILLIIKYYLMFYKNLYEKECEIDIEAYKVLYAYNWYGNVRELKFFIENLFISSDKYTCNIEDIPEYIRDNNEALYFINLFMNDKISSISDKKIEDITECLEKEMILMALKDSKNSTEAAKKLQITQSTMSRKIKKYNININE